jgi:predicted unusual protein kinase regulating ubiquinone biosynthesis (AarF/ABC1/UbiB family)
VAERDATPARAGADNRRERREEQIPEGRWGRLWEVSGVLSRVGAATVATRALGVFLPPETRARRKAEAWARNGERLAEAIGRLKGGPMKIVQMISLQDDLLPPEIAGWLRRLQKDAPPVPFEKLKRIIRDDFRPYREVFRELDPQPMAAASIGQVHRGVLADGREVAVKVQYPGIRRMIRADLRNLRGLFELAATLYLDIDVELLWGELERRLLEELDYRHEFANQERFRRLYAGDARVVVPEPIAAASSGRVLTTELVRGMSIDEALSQRVDAEERDAWGELLFRELARQILLYGVVHSDPNLANFAFLPEGRVVLYDFGSIKEVPEALQRGYAAVLSAALAGETERIPAELAAMGFTHADGRPLSRAMVDRYLQVFAPLLGHRVQPLQHLIRRLTRLGREAMAESRDIRFPADIPFIHRAIGGLIGNLGRLGARAAWGELLRQVLAERRGRGG